MTDPDRSAPGDPLAGIAAKERLEQIWNMLPFDIKLVVMQKFPNGLDPIYAALREAVVPPPASGWQPIATVPKDGSRFDVWAKGWLPAFDRFEYQRFADCYWRDADPMGSWKAGIVGCDKGWHPTHWMPLPSAPLPASPAAAGTENG